MTKMLADDPSLLDQEYVPISDFQDTANEEITSASEERKDYFQENFQKAVNRAQTIAAILIEHAPDKALTVANVAISSFRNSLVAAYTSKAATGDLEDSIIQSLKETDLLVGPTQKEIEALEESLAQKRTDIEALKEFIADEETKIDEALKADQEKHQEAINNTQEQIETLKAELIENLNNPEFDRDFSKQWINILESDLKTLVQAEHERLPSTLDNFDLRFINDSRDEIAKLEAEIESLEAQIADARFEAAPTFELGAKYGVREHLELCDVKTNAVLGYFASKNDPRSMKFIEAMSARMTDVLREELNSCMAEAKEAQESGNLDDAIRLLQKANDIKTRCPEVLEEKNEAPVAPKQPKSLEETLRELAGLNLLFPDTDIPLIPDPLTKLLDPKIPIKFPYGLGIASPFEKNPYPLGEPSFGDLLKTKKRPEKTLSEEDKKLIRDTGSGVVEVLSQAQDGSAEIKLLDFDNKSIGTFAAKLVKKLSEVKNQIIVRLVGTGDKSSVWGHKDPDILTEDDLAQDPHYVITKRIEDRAANQEESNTPK